MAILFNNYISIRIKSFTLWMQFLFSLILSISVYFYLKLFFNVHNIKSIMKFRIGLISSIGIIAFIFIVNLSYLMVYEYITNMRHVLKINNPMHHYINKAIIQGITTFMNLISMVSVLGYVIHISGVTLLISLIISSCFVFLLSDIIFNEFLYNRNTYILNASHSNNKLFIKPSDLIFNVTKDKMPNYPRLRMFYPDISNRIIKIYTYITLLKKYYDKLCLMYGSFNNVEPIFTSFISLIEYLIKNNTGKYRSKKPSSYDFGEIKMRWYRLKYNLQDVKVQSKDLKNFDAKRLKEFMYNLNLMYNYINKISDVLKDTDKKSNK